ncbi:fused PTS fructose transporter subunit IIA/HPr protein [Lonepinella sp. MS14436]|uniref:fused PTS fructose transporter subunit IIA/HPr protein n=1 Tax=Lonepinella sp. MS14436 TaxID=3003619 RepID=UPI0036D9879B
MFNLPENYIHLAAQAENKQQAIEMAAAALSEAGLVEPAYVQGMLAREQQTSTFLGNGIAIPHGTLETRSLVKDTGVAVFQFPRGVEWSEGNTAYVVIAIAARSDEHLTLLRQLTQILDDEDTAARLATESDVGKFRSLLLGEQQVLNVSAETITLDVDTDSLLTLTAINAGKLESQSAVENSFVSEVIGSPALSLGHGLWLTDSTVGNLKNGLAFSRAKNNALAVVTVSSKDDGVNNVLARLLEPNVQQCLLQGSVAQILSALNGEEIVVNSQQPSDAKKVVIGTFTIRNEHGLHARPGALVVSILKSFQSQITVQNLNRESKAVNAKSAMKIVSLGAVQGHRLRFIAEGEDALVAIQTLGKAFAEGLGESPVLTALTEPDSIEVKSINAESAVQKSAENPETASEPSIEATFTLSNEHGLHARPATMLANEVKKHNASVAVQNLDRGTALVSAKSVMKIVSLGAVKGHRLRFVATGEQAQQAIDGIGAAIAAGLGE